MATRKQKHERALQHHAQRMEENRRRGEAALQQDRARRAALELQEWEDNHNKNHSWQKRIKECPHCRIEMRAARKAAEDQDGPQPSDAFALEH